MQESCYYNKVQGYLVICVFILRGFGFARLGKIINMVAIKKKNVRFTTRTQIYTVCGRSKAKIVRFTTHRPNSVVHDFRSSSSEILFYSILSLHGAFRNVTPRIIESSLYM